MKIRTVDNGVFFFREEIDGTKKQFLALLDKLNLVYNQAGNLAVVDFIKKYNRKLYENQK